MFGIFKKEKFNYNTLEETKVLNKKQSVKETIEEIHTTFFTEVDRIKKESSEIKSLDTTKQNLIDKRNKLIKLGFNNSKEVKEANLEIDRLNTLKKENELNQSINKAANYFSFTYPQYKFITEESVKKICAKYNLIYGDVSNYIGIIPDKNLKHIEEFKIKEQDECYELHRNDIFLWGRGRSFERYVTKPINDDISEHERYMQSVMHYSTKISKSNLEICAPIKDFNIKNMEIKNFKLSKIEIPDPVVLKPVIFEDKKYYLIITAWGDEASDELVVNQKMN